MINIIAICLGLLSECYGLLNHFCMHELTGISFFSCSIIPFLVDSVVCHGSQVGMILLFSYCFFFITRCGLSRSTLIIQLRFLEKRNVTDVGYFILQMEFCKRKKNLPLTKGRLIPAQPNFHTLHKSEQCSPNH